MPNFNIEDFDTKVMILKSPMLKGVDETLVEVIKDGLVSYLFDLGDPDSGVNDEYYYNFLRSKYYNEYDEPILPAFTPEGIEFLKNETFVFQRALDTVQEKLSELVEVNQDALSVMYMTTVNDIFVVPFRPNINDYVMLALVLRKQND